MLGLQHPSPIQMLKVESSGTINNIKRRYAIVTDLIELHSANFFSNSSSILPDQQHLIFAGKHLFDDEIE